MNEHTTLYIDPSWQKMKIPTTIEEIIGGGASTRGYHAASDYLSCPERSRLKSIGLKLKNTGIIDDIEVGPLVFGSLMHSLLAIRVVHGMAVAEAMIRPGSGIGNSIHEEWRLKAHELLLTYDREWPMSGQFTEGAWLYIGCESTVDTEIAPGVVRTARYDKIVQTSESGRKVVYSVEHKTASRAGEWAMISYTPQFYVQATIWNRNDELVKRYGPMIGVIPDILVKTKVPKCERYAPRYVSERQMDLAVEYMTLPDKIVFPINADGSYPHFIHTCFGGKYGHCEYTEYCLESAKNAYEIEEK
jgi:hypothetical protein